VRSFCIVVILAGTFVIAAFSQFVGDCPASNWDHPIWVKSVAGVVIDETGAVIPKTQVILQPKQGKTFVNLEDVQTGSVGKFSMGEHQTGEYRLVVRGPKGFCRLSLPVTITEKGWSGFTLTLPVAATDTCQSYCDQRARIEEMKP